MFGSLPNAQNLYAPKMNAYNKRLWPKTWYAMPAWAAQPSSAF
jgi:hypothetical protein